MRDWDMVGYETLIDYLAQHNTLAVKGDVLEIGAFCGGGTRKLAEWMKVNAPGRVVWAVDVFDTQFDQSMNKDGLLMAEMYAAWLGGESQWDVFVQNVKEFENVRGVLGDSRTIRIPRVPLCFGFIDGCHEAEWVESDFELVWSLLNKGGVAAVHDYGKDIPVVTRTIDRIIEQKGLYVESIDLDKGIIYIQRVG